MSSSIVDRSEEFFDRLETALGSPSPQTREVVREVRADFRAQVAALREGGMEEGAAVDQVLADLGEPEALAAGMQQVLPPLSSGPVAVVRYVLAGGGIIWTLLLMWTFRAWDYGPSAGMFFALLFHLPVILVLWPRVIWRKNWLFGLVPAAVLVGAAFVLNVAGTSQTSQEIVITEDGAWAAPADVEVAELDDGVRWQFVVLFSALSVAMVVLFGMMQQRRQRVVALVVALVPVLIVEGAFQWEERVFRQERDRLAELVKGGREPLPERGKLRELGLGKRGSYALSEDGRSFSVWWPRPLSSGFSIAYDSKDQRIWVND